MDSILLSAFSMGTRLLGSSELSACLSGRPRSKRALRNSAIRGLAHIPKSMTDMGTTIPIRINMALFGCVNFLFLE